MKNTFNVTLNEKIIYSYSNKAAPARLRRYLDELDDEMSKGIQLGAIFENKPSVIQKQQYVAMKLLNAIENQDMNLVEVLSAYLINRNTNLKQVSFIEKDELINLKLI